ncbi:MAG: putative glycolipid-binding domain-containing protein [Alphaproteobacteria bacterium]|nr:putative glycolipid-binding domain-containing protein [Alphaproteobacteria bacterium]
MDRDRTIFWKRLDVDGSEACGIRRRADGGWAVDGTANFVEESEVASLAYTIRCAPDWTSEQAQVTGWHGSRDVDIALSREGDGGWSLNGARLDGVAGARDVDLGFTPATNTLAIRRLRLAVGARAEVTALWLDTQDWQVKPLVQSYERLQERVYRYTSPGYRFDLQVDDFGLVIDYPGLWGART